VPSLGDGERCSAASSVVTVGVVSTEGVFILEAPLTKEAPLSLPIPRVAVRPVGVCCRTREESTFASYSLDSQ